jgi:hypothetical protein
MAIADRMETTVCGTARHGSGRENARVSVSRMSNSELLRFGLTAKFRLSEGPAPSDSELTGLESQLSDARAEWNRRHPDLPLRDSF